MLLSKGELTTLGYITESGGGPLSITVVTADEIRVTDVLYGGADVCAQLTLGRELSAVLAELPALKHQTTSFPIADLQSMRWNNRNNAVVLERQGDLRPKRVTTCIDGAIERDMFIAHIEKVRGGASRVRDEPISIFRIIWAQLLGAIVAILGTGFIYANWDNFNFDNIRYGAIPEMLGRSGCVVVGAGIVVACMIAAWWELRKKPTYYYVTF